MALIDRWAAWRGWKVDWSPEAAMPLERDWTYTRSRIGHYTRYLRARALLRRGRFPLAATLKPVFPAARWNLYFLYLPDGELHDAHRYTIDRLRWGDARLLLVVASPDPAAAERLLAMADAVVWKGMAGFDFSAYALGIDAHEVWPMPDGALERDVPFLSLAAEITKAFHRFEPDLVVTFWPESGATGHRDHMRIGLAAQHAVRQFDGIHVYQGPSKIAYTLMPRGVMQRLGGERGDFVADNQPDPTHSMPSNADAKLRGWDIHESQSDYVEAVYQVPANVLYSFFDKEFYFVEEVR